MSENRSAKDKQMAARLKDQKVQRVSQMCPICYKIVRNDQYTNHIATHK